MFSYMKNLLKLLVITLICSCTCVLAEGCDYNTIATLKNQAAKVSVSYDILEEAGSYSIKYKIYNVTDDIYISYYNEKSADSIVISSGNLVNGIYEFVDYNVEDIYEYKFDVKAMNSSCGTLRTISSVKPRRNPVYDDPECHYEDTSNLYYCREWVSQKFPYTDERILEIVKKNRKEAQKNTMTTKSVEQKKEEEESFLQKFLKIAKTKRFVLFVLLVIGVISDVIFMVSYYRRIKKESEML